ncbi:MAG: hypothetical protein ABW146_08605 [Candidatus Sedimenticola sp. 6PFRAG7]
MRYLTARGRIKDGDLIALKRSRGWFWQLVRWVTRSAYTHTAVAVWLEGGLYVVEMNSAGNVLVPLSQYRSPFDVFACPVNRAQAKEMALWSLRNPIGYGWTDLLYIAAHNLLALRTPRDTGGIVCSALSALIYRQAGWQATLPNIPSPADLVAALGESQMEVQP